MICGQRQTKPRGSRRDSWRANRSNTESPRLQVSGEMKGGIVVPKDDRYDLRIEAGDGEAVASQSMPKEGAQFQQSRALEFRFRGEIHPRGNLRSEIRRQRSIENKRASAIDQKAAQVLLTANKCSGRDERFAASVHGRKTAV